MVTFTCKITDPSGLPPKTAGKLVERATQCSGRVVMRNGEKTGDAKLIFNVLCLSVKYGDEVEFSVDGDNAEEDAKELKAFLDTLI